MTRFPFAGFMLLSALLLGAFLIVSCDEDDNTNWPVVANERPDILALSSEVTTTYPDSSVEVTVVAEDPDGDNLYYSWNATGGNFVGERSAATVTWKAPPEADQRVYEVTAIVSDIADDMRGDGYTSSSTAKLAITVNRNPETPHSPAPDTNATQIDYDNVVLAWAGGDPEGDEVLYDVYLHTTPNFSGVDPIATDLIDTSYAAGALDPATIYHWKVMAHNETGFETESETWSFSTEWNIGSPPQGAQAGDEWSAVIGMDELELNMVFLPSGSFTMGSDDSGNIEETPTREVEIGNGFWMGKFELTEQQYYAIMLHQPNLDTLDATIPKKRVAWNDADALVAELNSHESGNPWRLPSEAEWEYAARAGTDTRFHWGEDADYDSLGLWAHYFSTAMSQVQPIGTLQPNPWGLYDMLGNVSEWVEDDWHPNFYGAPDDADPWIDSPRAYRRVMKGGNAGSTASRCRPAYRFSKQPEDDNLTAGGIRLVRERN